MSKVSCCAASRAGGRTDRSLVVVEERVIQDHLARRARGPRLVIAGSIVSLALTGSVLAVPPALALDPLLTETAAEVSQIVRVSTPDFAARDRLTALGLDMTEHGGPGFVEVLLHGAADADLLRQAGFVWSSRCPTWGWRGAPSDQASAAYAAVHRGLAAVQRARRLPLARPISTRSPPLTRAW